MSGASQSKFFIEYVASQADSLRGLVDNVDPAFHQNAQVIEASDLLIAAIGTARTKLRTANGPPEVISEEQGADQDTHEAPCQPQAQKSSADSDIQAGPDLNTYTATDLDKAVKDAVTENNAKWLTSQTDTGIDNIKKVKQLQHKLDNITKKHKSKMRVHKRRPVLLKSAASAGTSDQKTHLLISQLRAELAQVKWVNDRLGHDIRNFRDSIRQRATQIERQYQRSFLEVAEYLDQYEAVGVDAYMCLGVAERQLRALGVDLATPERNIFGQQATNFLGIDSEGIRIRNVQWWRNPGQLLPIVDPMDILLGNLKDLSRHFHEKVAEELHEQVEDSFSLEDSDDVEDTVPFDIFEDAQDGDVDTSEDLFPPEAPRIEEVVDEGVVFPGEANRGKSRKDNQNLVTSLAENESEPELALTNESNTSEVPSSPGNNYRGITTGAGPDQGSTDDLVDNDEVAINEYHELLSGGATVLEEGDHTGPSKTFTVPGLSDSDFSDNESESEGYNDSEMFSEEPEAGSDVAGFVQGAMGSIDAAFTRCTSEDGDESQNETNQEAGGTSLSQNVMAWMLDDAELEADDGVEATEAGLHALDDHEADGFSSVAEDGTVPLVEVVDDSMSDPDAEEGGVSLSESMQVSSSNATTISVISAPDHEGKEIQSMDEDEYIVWGGRDYLSTTLTALLEDQVGDAMGELDLEDGGVSLSASSNTWDQEESTLLEQDHVDISKSTVDQRALDNIHVAKTEDATPSLDASAASGKDEKKAICTKKFRGSRQKVKEIGGLIKQAFKRVSHKHKA